MRFRVTVLVVLAGFVALLAPAVPALSRYATLPHAPERPVNVLLAGVTPHYDDAAPVWPWPIKPEAYDWLTDTIVLAQFRADGHVELMSIPRDTWVDTPGHGSGKINAVNKRGPEVLVDVVQSLVGLSIDGYALLSLNALRDLTTASGGVTLDVPQRMKYDDNAGHLHVDLQPGRQHLSGAEVKGFLRFRHDNLGDIGRVARQQLYLQALAHTLSRPLNLWRWPGVVGALDRNTRTDLSRQTVAQMLGALLRGPKVNSHTLPGDFGPGGTWAADRAGIQALVNSSFSNPSDPRTRTIAVANIDAPAGAARALQLKLLADGYRTVWIANLQRGGAPTTFISG